MASLRCYNPLCPSRSKMFSTERALSMHLYHTEVCCKYADQHHARQLAPASVSSHDQGPPPHLQHPRLERDRQNLFVLETSDYQQPDWEEPGYVEFDTAQLDEDAYPLPYPMGNTKNQEYDFFIHSIDQKCLVELMLIMDEMGAPDYGFQKVLKWAISANHSGFSFKPDHGLSRRSNIKWMYDMSQRAKMRLPTVVPTVLEGGKISEAVVFEFASTLLSLLQDPAIMTKENLVLDWANPLAKVVPADGRLGEALSGSVYQTHFSDFIKEPTKQLLVPIGSWFDRAVVTGDSRFSLQPWMFTPLIFTEKFRRKIEAWEVLGYMPGFKDSSAEKKRMSKGQTCRNYHKLIDTILEPFRQAEKYLKGVKLPIGENGPIVADIICPMLYIIQDIDEGDRDTGRHKTHTPGTKRQCRACDVDFENLDNTDYQCTYVTAEQMRAVAEGDDEELQKRWSTHQLTNAFNKIPFMDPVRGIFGATPTEIMHVFEGGAMKRALQIFLHDDLTDTQRLKFDNMAKNFHKMHSQTYRSFYPTTSFGNCVTNLTRISCGENVGMVFLIVILSHYKEGWELLTGALKKQCSTDLKDVIELMEAMLCFSAWLKLPQHWKLDKEEEAMEDAQNAIRVLLNMILEQLPRVDGNGWCIPKFHELLHILLDMVRFGAAINFCAQHVEGFLKITAKKVGKRAQKRHIGTLFEQQSAKRFADSRMVQQLYSRMERNNLIPGSLEPLDKEWEDEDDNIKLRQEEDYIVESHDRATFATLTRDENGIKLKWHTRSTKDLSIRMDLAHYLLDNFGDCVTFCTEYVRDDLKFRCHPNFQDGGPMYDWFRVLFNLEDDDGTSFQQTIPCQLQAVVITNYNTSEQKYHLVVQFCKEINENGSSVLFTEWDFDPQTYHTVETSSLHSPCFVVMISDKRVVEAKPLEQWPWQFTENHTGTNTDDINFDLYRH